MNPVVKYEIIKWPRSSLDDVFVDRICLRRKMFAISELGRKEIQFFLISPEPSGSSSDSLSSRDNLFK